MYVDVLRPAQAHGEKCAMKLGVVCYLRIYETFIRTQKKSPSRFSSKSVAITSFYDKMFKFLKPELHTGSGHPFFMTGSGVSHKRIQYKLFS